MEFLYNPYGQEHGWQARVESYTHGCGKTRDEQLAWLRQEWRENNGSTKQNLLVIAKQVKTYGWRRAWRSWWPPMQVDRQVIAQAVQGILKQGLV